MIALGDVERVRGLHAAADRISVSTACYQEVLLIAQQNHFTPMLASTLEGLSYIAIIKDEYAFAAKLLGAAQTRREAVDLIRFAHEVACYQHNLALLQTKLSEADFTVAWQEGQAMSLDQIITYALSGLPQLATQS